MQWREPCVSVLDQVNTVNASAVVASYLTGNSAFVKAVEKLLQSVDLIIQGMFTLTRQGLVEILRGVENCRRIPLGVDGLLMEDAEQFGQTLAAQEVIQRGKMRHLR